jgi:hypothetical protein
VYKAFLTQNSGSGTEGEVLKRTKVEILTEYYNNTRHLEEILESGHRPARPYRVYNGLKTAEARSARRRAIRRNEARDVVEIWPFSDSGHWAQATRQQGSHKAEST